MTNKKKLAITLLLIIGYANYGVAKEVSVKEELTNKCGFLFSLSECQNLFVSQAAYLENSRHYDEFESFSKGLIRVSKDEKYGLIDKKGKTILPVDYDFIGVFYEIDYLENEKVKFIKKDEKLGLIDKQGEIILPILYDDITKYRDDLYVTEMNYKYGLADDKGNILLSTEYDRVYPEYYNNSEELIYVQKDLKKGWCVRKYAEEMKGG